MNAAPDDDRQRDGILLRRTPPRWFDVASERWRELLVDHANCEKKAASTALSLIFAYAEDLALTDRLSRLAREELRHFEQVQKLMQELQVPFMRLAPSRYAEGLRRARPSRRAAATAGSAAVRSADRSALVRTLRGSGAALARTAGAVSTQGWPYRRRDTKSLYLRLVEQRAHGADWRDAAGARGDRSGAGDVADPQFRFHSGEPSGAVIMR